MPKLAITNRVLLSKNTPVLLFKNAAAFSRNALAFFLVTAFALGLSSYSLAEDQAAPNPLSILESKFAPSQGAPGGTAKLELKVNLAEHYHAYSDRFKIRLENPEEIKVDKIVLTPLVSFKDVVSGGMKEGIEGNATVTALMEFPESMKAGKVDVNFALTYQACSKDTCLFPITLHLKAPYDLSGSVAPKVAQASVSAVAPKGDFEKRIGQGILSAMLFVFLVGVGTSLTPCIYPMIPITLAVLGAKSKGQTRMRSFLLSLAYVLGIGATYSTLGVIAASTGSLFGSALSNVYVVSAIALTFVAMGLSMYGLFEIQAPAFIRDRLGSGQSQTGFGGAFVTGLVAGVVASPCIGPVLVSVLAYIAQTQIYFWDSPLLFTFAMGMGMLFIVLGTFSHLFNAVPKAGAWMEAVKFVFGTTMVGMGLYYIAPIYPTWLFQALLALSLILIASAFGAFEPNEKLTGIGRLRKGVMLATFTMGVLLALISTASKLGVALPTGGGPVASSAVPSKKMNWKNFSSEAVAAAAQDHKPVIIDFSAEWCGACKELEKYTFNDEKIIDESERFVLLRVDATEDSDALTKLKNQYQVVGLPTMIFISTDGQVQPTQTLTGFEEAPGFLARMKTVQTSTASNRAISSEK